jgi:hypothetical protein
MEVSRDPLFLPETPLDQLLMSSLIRDTLELVTKEQRIRKKTPSRKIDLEERDLPVSKIDFSRASDVRASEGEEKQLQKLEEEYLGSF